MAAPCPARYLNGLMSGALKNELRAIVGEQGILEGDAVRERAATLWHGRVDAELLVRPRSTEQVSAVLRVCHARAQAVVTHGGLTGLVNGADANATDIVLSLESMNAIERIDVPGRTLRAQAGAKLGQVQRAAEEQGMVFPLDLGRVTARPWAATSRPMPADCGSCATE
jgi:FAD/FMN-containing dehydrogenase